MDESAGSGGPSDRADSRVRDGSLPVARSVALDWVRVSWLDPVPGGEPHATLRRTYESLRDRLRALGEGGFVCGGYSLDPRRGLCVVWMAAEAGYGHELLALAHTYQRESCMPSGAHLSLAPARPGPGGRT